MGQQHWFKWWQGTCADPKFRMLADQVNMPVAAVLGTWIVLLGHTVSSGKIELDLAAAPDMLGIEPATFAAIFAGLERFGFIANGRVVNWHKRYAGSRKRLCELLWTPIRERIFKRDNYTCRYCGVRGGVLECDHVQPLSRGGTNDDANLATACKPCNRAKGRKTVDEWMAA